MPLSNKDGLKIAIKTAGSRRALGRLIGVAHQSIAEWERIPAERVLDTERATGVPRDVLRPDLFGSLAPRPPRKKKITGNQNPTSR